MIIIDTMTRLRLHYRHFIIVNTPPPPDIVHDGHMPSDNTTARRYDKTQTTALTASDG
jgi:hypothetical protein